jgi:ABC-type spermidine/putrescine transport system permease subunit II
MAAVRRSRSWVGLWWMTPFLAVFALVFIAPIGYAAFLSLYRDQLVGGNRFVGLDNFRAALADPRFWASVGRVSLFLVVQVPVMLLLALGVALAIDSGRLYGRAMFRLSIFLPDAVPAVVATLMWGFMYGPQFGLVASLNETFGLAIPNPLQPDLALAAIGNAVTWEYVGYNMLIFYAALRVIPKTLYEAAAIDGAGEFRVIRAVKLSSRPCSRTSRWRWTTAPSVHCGQTGSASPIRASTSLRTTNPVSTRVDRRSPAARSPTGPRRTSRPGWARPACARSSRTACPRPASTVNCRLPHGAGSSWPSATRRGRILLLHQRDRRAGRPRRGRRAPPGTRCPVR